MTHIIRLRKEGTLCFMSRGGRKNQKTTLTAHKESWGWIGYDWKTKENNMLNSFFDDVKLVKQSVNFKRLKRFNSFCLISIVTCGSIKFKTRFIKFFN